MKRIIKNKLNKLASVLNDLKIDVSVVLFAYREESSAETSNYDEWAQFLKKSHILKWTVKVLNYEVVYDRNYHKDCFYYCLVASLDGEVHMDYSIECNEVKQCSIDFYNDNDATFDFAENLINPEDLDTRESLCTKLDDYIQIYSK